MISVLFFWLSNSIDITRTRGIVEVDYTDYEAIYVPPEHQGPIVALPVDEIFLCQGVKNAISP